MEFFCGLDVAIEETAVCVVDDRGEMHLMEKVTTESEVLFAVLKPFIVRLRRVGHEAGSLSPWLHPELVKLGLPVICLEGILPAARSRRENRRPHRTVPALPGDPRRRAGDGALVHDGDRRSHTLPPLARCCGLLRVDLAALAVRYVDRRERAHLEGRRCGRAPCSLRGGVWPDDALQGKDKVKAWGQQIAKRSCYRKAVVAVARKLAVIMHAMWSDGTFYVGDPAASETDTTRRTQVKDRELLERIDEQTNDGRNAGRPQNDGRDLNTEIRCGG